ncbi:MAG: hypothetical protein ACQEVA_09685 [Myxococcota bacterium]
MENADTRRRNGVLFALLIATLSLVVFGVPSPVSAQDKAENGEADKPAESTDEDGADSEGGPSYVGVGLGFYTENSRLDGETTRQIDTDDDSFDYSADNFLQGSIWTMMSAGDRLRAGIGLHYYGSYETVREPEEDEDPEDIDARELGQYATLFARGEWLLPFADDYELVLGAEAGVSALFPDGEFRRRIEGMEEDGISVFSGPRPGISLAPLVGARWQLDERLALRADFAVRWERIFLFNVSDTVENISYERTWTAKVLRYNLGIGMEVTL